MSESKTTHTEIAIEALRRLRGRLGPDDRAVLDTAFEVIFGPGGLADAASLVELLEFKIGATKWLAEYQGPLLERELTGTKVALGVTDLLEGLNNPAIQALASALNDPAGSPEAQLGAVLAAGFELLTVLHAIKLGAAGTKHLLGSREALNITAVLAEHPGSRRSSDESPED